MAKTSDWGQSAVDRKDFRHGKSDPAKDKPTPKKSGHKKKKSVTLQYKFSGTSFPWSGSWMNWGKYRNREVAVEVWKQQLKKMWYKDSEWRIKGERNPLSEETENAKSV